MLLISTVKKWRRMLVVARRILHNLIRSTLHVLTSQNISHIQKNPENLYICFINPSLLL